MEVPSVDIPTAQQEVVAQQDVVSPEECIHHAVVEIQNQAESAEAVTDITNLTSKNKKITINGRLICRTILFIFRIVLLVSLLIGAAFARYPRKFHQYPPRSL